jgi:hypothetical protein
VCRRKIKFLSGKAPPTADNLVLLSGVGNELERLLSEEPPPAPFDTPPLPQDEVPPELAEVFALESEDHLRSISALLPTLEREPNNREVLQETYRTSIPHMPIRPYVNKEMVARALNLTPRRRSTGGTGTVLRQQFD